MIRFVSPWQSVEISLPVFTVENPKAQGIQSADPVMSLYDPISHGIHWVVSEALGNWPSGQSPKNAIHTVS